MARAELPRLLRYATALSGDGDQARDLVQDVLARALTRWDRIGRTDRPAAYLMRMVTNEHVSWRRRRAHRSEVPIIDGDLDGTASGDHSERIVQHADLQQRLARLPRRQQAALVLRFYEGLDYVESAAVLGCAEGTVRSAVSRGLSALRADDRPPGPSLTLAVRTHPKEDLMNHELTQLLHQRAELAHEDLDLDQALLEVRERASGLEHRRRNLLAAGGGALTIAAVTGALLVVTPNGTSTSDQVSQRGRQAAGPVSPAPFTPDTTAAVAARSGTTTNGNPTGLVSITPAPASAPLSLGLVPAGYTYITSTDAVTVYGPPSTRHSPSYYLDKLTVAVGERYDHLTGPDTVAGHTGAIVADTARNDGSWSVTIDYSSNIEITLQVPGSAALTRPQIQALADTIDIRDVNNPTHG